MCLVVAGGRRRPETERVMECNEVRTVVRHSYGCWTNFGRRFQFIASELIFYYNYIPYSSSQCCSRPSSPAFDFNNMLRFLRSYTHHHRPPPLQHNGYYRLGTTHSAYAHTLNAFISCMYANCVINFTLCFCFTGGPRWFPSFVYVVVVVVGYCKFYCKSCRCLCYYHYCYCYGYSYCYCCCSCFTCYIFDYFCYSWKLLLLFVLFLQRFLVVGP